MSLGSLPPSPGSPLGPTGASQSNFPPSTLNFSGQTQLNGASTSGSSYGQVRHASKLPLIFSIVAILVSASAYFLAGPFGSNLFYVLGYFLTPIVVFGTVTWDHLSQRVGSRDEWFSMNKPLTKTLQILAYISLIPAGFHIVAIGQWLGQVAVQQGWLSA